MRFHKATSEGPGEERRRKAAPVPDSSRYVRRSAELPPLGDEAEHEVLEEMEALRRVNFSNR